jgi:hypothetical protein
VRLGGNPPCGCRRTRVAAGATNTWRWRRRASLRDHSDLMLRTTGTDGIDGLTEDAAP